MSNGRKGRGRDGIYECVEIIKQGESSRYDSYHLLLICHDVDSIGALQQAVSLLVEKGRFSAAANNQKQIAEMYETDVKDPKKAKDAYETAAEWYSGEDSKAYALSVLCD